MDKNVFATMVLELIKERFELLEEIERLKGINEATAENIKFLRKIIDDKDSKMDTSEVWRVANGMD